MRRSQRARRKKSKCEICGAPATHVCPICGRSVCDNHWAGDKCVICAETLCAICGQRLAVAACAICGRPICEQCSVQITPVVRVCKECAVKYGIKPGVWPPRGLVEKDLRELASRLNRLLSEPRFPSLSRP
jgi:hypothetical protein